MPLTDMKTTRMEVASPSGVEVKIPEHPPSKNTKAIPGIISRIRMKKIPVLRVDPKLEPGVQILIGTRHQMVRAGEAVAPFTQRTMRTSLLQSVRSHHIPDPGRHLLLLRKGCGLRGFLSAPSTKQVGKVSKYG